MADSKHFAPPASEIANTSIGAALRGRSQERTEVISIIGLVLTSRQAYASEGKMIAPFSTVCFSAKLQSICPY